MHGKNVAVLDFSFDSKTTLEQLSVAKGYAVLDHHKTAKDNLADLPESAKVFDMQMSGATLAWNYFHPGEACPLLARYVEDRDIWRWAYHSSKEFSAVFELAVGLPPPGELVVPSESFCLLDTLHKGGDVAFQSLLAQGKAILEYQSTLINAASRKATLRRLRAFPEMACAVVNSTVCVSEIGDIITQIEGAAFALIFAVEGERIQVSLRSGFPAEGQADVSEIAKKFGGGGHQAASGCRFETTDIETMLISR